MQSIAAAAEPPFEDKLQSLHDQQTQLDQLQKQLEQLQQLKQQLMGKSQEAQAKLRSQDDQISDQDTELLKAHSDHKRLLLSLDTMQQQLDTVGHAPKIQELQESSIHAQDTTHSQESCHMPTHQENQDEMHDLMRKLMDASVEELRGPEAPLAESEATNIKTEEPTFSETVLEPAPVNDRLSLDQMDIQETSQKIGQAKTQINFQIQQLKDNKGLIESADDQLYYDMIYKKLTGQLADLTTAEEKIELYKSLLQEYHAHEDIQAEEGEQVDDQDYNDQLEDEEDQEFGDETQGFEKDIAEDERAQAFEDLLEQGIKEQQSQSQSQSNLPVIEMRAPKQPTIKIEPGTSVRGCISGLYNDQKARIEKRVAAVLSAYETNPSFLLTLFQALPKLAQDDYAQQKLLCMIDELTDSTQLEEYPAADLKEAESVRSRIHLSNFAFLESVLANGPLTAEQIQDVTHHVTSIMYAQLIASPSPSNPKGMHPAAAIRVLGETAPLLARLMDVYIGQDPKVAPMLAYDINRVFDSVFGWTDEEE